MKSLNKAKGFTILEVMIALVVFGCISAILLNAITAADRIRARSTMLRNACLLASNETERVKCASFQNRKIEDSVYTCSVNEHSYEIKRTVIEPSDPVNADTSLVELEISVNPSSSPSEPLYRFRFLQGYQR